jgi:hypothetical protein
VRFTIWLNIVGPVHDVPGPTSTIFLSSRNTGWMTDDPEHMAEVGTFLGRGASVLNSC